mmetsp:Transcript_18081/g.25752  ORF Transcript_18081/g.25752 Transcript_18081/m.25752 type:complete len:458 (+) Transcript_18081:27-1400(+)
MMLLLFRTVKQPVTLTVRASTPVFFLPKVNTLIQKKLVRANTTNSRLGIRLVGSDILPITDALISNGITLFDSFGSNEEALCQALEASIIETRITVLSRVGYRTNDKQQSQQLAFPNDVWLKDNEACHNIGPEYIQHCLTNSPLVKLKQQNPSLMDLVFMVHNPETQGYDEEEEFVVSRRRDTIRDRLRQSFIALEEACLSNQISSYGVCSNGLSLQESHALYLNWNDVLDVASEAAAIVVPNNGSSKLRAFQLPANLFETHGLVVAEQIHNYISNNNNTQYYSNNIDIYVSRPLTCYADQGVGSVPPIRCLDYEMDITVDGQKMLWTHLVPEGVLQSQYYHPALNAAMSHFDAEAILEVQKERPLTVEERETVQGCRLLQQLIYDLDTSISKNTKSFQEYEDDLRTKVIPLIHNAFEELDETSANVLQNFFKAHGAAIRVSCLVVVYTLYIIYTIL